MPKTAAKVSHPYHRATPRRPKYLRNLLTTILVLGVFVLPVSQGKAASFDCNKAGTQVEKAICADLELGRLDEDLMAAYKKVASTERTAQRAWLKHRNACGPNVQCLKSLYEERVAKLQRMAGQAQSTPTAAKRLIPDDQCAVIVMASKDTQQVLDALKTYQDIAPSPVVIESNNGFFAAALGIFDRAEGASFMMTPRAAGRLPKDAYCGNTERYAQILYPAADYSNFVEDPTLLPHKATSVKLTTKQVDDSRNAFTSTEPTRESVGQTDATAEGRTTMTNVAKLSGSAPWGRHSARASDGEYEYFISELTSTPDTNTSFRELIESEISEQVAIHTKDFESWQGPRVCVKGPASYLSDMILSTYSDDDYFPREICLQRGGYQIVKYPYLPSVFGYSPSGDLIAIIEKLEDCGVRHSTVGYDTLAFASVTIECRVPDASKVATEAYVTFEVSASFADTPWREKLWRVRSTKVEFCGPSKRLFTPEDFRTLGMHQELKKKFGERYALERGLTTDAEIAKYVEENFEGHRRFQRPDALYNVDLASPLSQMAIDEIPRNRSEKAEASCTDGESLYSITVIEGSDYESIENRIFSKVQAKRAKKKEPTGF